MDPEYWSDLIKADSVVSKIVKHMKLPASPIFKRDFFEKDFSLKDYSDHLPDCEAYTSYSTSRMYAVSDFDERPSVEDIFRSIQWEVKADRLLDTRRLYLYFKIGYEKMTLCGIIYDYIKEPLNEVRHMLLKDLSHVISERLGYDESSVREQLLKCSGE